MYSLHWTGQCAQLEKTSAKKTNNESVDTKISECRGLRSASVVAYLRSLSVVAYLRSLSVVAYLRSLSVVAYLRSLSVVAYLRSLSVVAYLRSLSVVAYLRSLSVVAYLRSLSVVAYLRSLSVVAYLRSLSVVAYLRSLSVVAYLRSLSVVAYLRSLSVVAYLRSLSVVAYLRSLSVVAYLRSLSVVAYLRSLSVVAYLRSLSVVAYLRSLSVVAYLRSLSVVAYLRSLSVVAYLRSLSVIAYIRSLTFVAYLVGDKVIAFSDYKAWSELVAVSANYVYKIGDNLNFHDGAALLMNFVVAYIIIFDLAGVREGQSILTHSLGGGIGQAIVQLANTIPNVTIFGTASSHKHETIKSKGNVAHLFDHNVDYTQAIRKESSDGVDVVLDCLCGDDTNKGIALLRPMGKYILYGSSNIVTGETKSFFSFAKSLQLPDKMVWWQVDKVNPLKLFDDNKVIGGFQLRRLLFRQGHYEYVRKVVNRVLDLYNQGKIKPTIDSVWAFEDVGEAMQKLCDRKNIGKIILDPTAEPKPKSPEKKVAEATASSEGASGGEEKKEAVVNGE
ncbi:Type I Polyketide synthase [Bulinus truncatus]|nr:Type I Polyketide synthase [Bulinus truncatus]